MKFRRPIFAISALFSSVISFAANEDNPTKAAAAEAPDPPERLIDELDQAALQEAFRLLRTEYINRDDFTYLEMNRAALQGLLDRLEFGATILTEKTRSSRNSPFKFYAERIDKTTGYVRFGRFAKTEIEKLDEALTEFKVDKLETLILDLRSPQPQADFAVAAEILSRFRPPNELLFKIRRPNDDRPRLFVAKAQSASWSKNLILLVDTETGNVGEIIAGVMKKQDEDLLVIGEATRGLTVEYRDVPVGKDRILRYAIAEVVLDDDSSLFQQGIHPTIVATGDLKKKHAIYRELEKPERDLAEFLFQKQRPRMNEAALVAGTDPELDYYLAKSQGKKTRWDTPPLFDRALQQAVDLLTTNAFFEESGKKKKTSAPGKDEKADKNADGEKDED